MIITATVVIVAVIITVKATVRSVLDRFRCMILQRIKNTERKRENCGDRE